ncbi:EpsG family protein [Pseudomonas sp. microsymbiont 2]
MELASRFLDVYTIVLLAVWGGALWAWALGGLNPRAEKAVFAVLSLMLIVFSATRYETGYDWPAYEEFYVMGDRLEGKYQFELGFRLLAGLFRYWALDFTAFQFFVSALQVFLVAVFIKKFFKTFALLALAVYYTVPDLYLINSFSLMRQGLALALFLCGAVYCFERKWLACGLFFLAASMFHTSSIFAIGVFFAVRLVGINYTLSKWCVWGLAACYLIGVNVPGGLISVLAALPFLQKYVIYEGLDTPSVSVLYKLLFTMLFLALFHLAGYRRRMQLRAGEYTPEQQFQFALACMAVVISFFFWAYPTFLSRFQAFFLFFLLAYIWRAFDFSTWVNRSLLCGVVCVVSGALYGKFVLTHLAMVYFPYQSLFSERIEVRSTGAQRVDELHEELRRLWRGSNE